MKKPIKMTSLSEGFGGLEQVTNSDVLQRRDRDTFERNWHVEMLALAAKNGWEADSAVFDDILSPPASMERLQETIDECPALGKNITAMSVNVGGLGYSFRQLIDVREKEDSGTWKLMMDEKRRLDSLFESLCVEHTTEDLFEMLVRQLESNGNAYWEVIRASNGRVIGINPIEDPKRMRLLKKDKVSQLYLHRTRVGTEYEQVLTPRFFRRFVYLEPGGSKKYFRQYGDNRQLDSQTGKYGDFQTIAQARRANEIIHFKLPHPASEYGVVRWISVLVDAICVRVAKLCNLDILDNSGTPPLVIVASGTDDDTFEQRIREQLEQIKAEKARTKVLILTLPPAEAGAGEGETVVQPKLELHPLGQLLIEEGMFMEFMKFSDAEIRSIFRIPPLLLGDLEETPNKSTADIAKQIAEEQVFAPARKKIEAQVNRLLMDHIMPGRKEPGVMFWRFALNTLSSDRTDTVLSVLKEAREGAAITPGQEQAIIATLLPEYKLESFDDERNDTPLAYQILDKGNGMQELVGPAADAAKETLRSLFNVPVKILQMELPGNDVNPYAA